MENTNKTIIVSKLGKTIKSPKQIENCSSQSLIEKRIENYLKVWSELAQNPNESINNVDNLLENIKLPKTNVKVLVDYDSNSKLQLLESQSIDNLNKNSFIQDQKNSSVNDFISCSVKKHSSGDDYDIEKVKSTSENDTVERSSAKEDQHVQKLNDEEILHLRKELTKKTIDLAEILPRYKFLQENFDNFLLIKADYLLMKQEKEIAIPKAPQNESVLQIDNFTQISRKGYSWINPNTIRLDRFYYERTKLTQTWDTTVICENCLKTRQMLENPKINSLIEVTNGGASCIATTDLEDLKEGFKLIKEKLAEREEDYENRKEVAQILRLVSSNNAHRDHITELEQKLNTTTKYANILQKIILKISSSQIKNLTSQEQKWVDKIKLICLTKTDTYGDENITELNTIQEIVENRSNF